MDFDQWEERAAIMEFCGGLSRLQAETLAAQAQGRQRWEFIQHADSIRNSAPARDRRPTDARGSANDMPGVQRASKEENRPVPQGDVQGGRGGVEVLALSVSGRGIL